MADPLTPGEGMMDDLLDDFLAETDENLDALTNDLVAWEKNPGDRSLLDGIFRFFHTIKGNSGFLDFARLGRLSHAAETALARARDGGVEPDGAFVSTILLAIDQIRALLVVLAETREEPSGCDAELISRLEDAAAPHRQESVGKAASMRAVQPMAEGHGLAPSVKAAPPATVRVPVGLLDRLMGLASELVLARNALVRSARHGEEIPNTLIEHVSACVTDLQDGINRTRMQPIEGLWTPLPRLVRDLSHELGKDVRLVLEGGDTEIDRQLLEVIRDPIGHMVRNAIDHGIEDEAARRQAGKAATGTLRLSAHQSGGHILIELNDDGRGISPDRLRARVVAMGLMSADAAAALSDSAAQALIFEPGLSTASAVTSISGRGVGMDVVKTNLERIGGTVEVNSRVGHGTSFIIRVPLTLTIVPALIVGVGGQSYAIAQSSIREIIRLRGMGTLSDIGGRKMVRLRDVLIPVIDLAALFGRPVDAMAERWGVIVEIGGVGRVAMLVDKVSDQEEIVIKPVSPLLARSGTYSGATVLGNGEAALVLDLAGIAMLGEVTEGAALDEAQTGTSGAAGSAASWMLFEVGGAVAKAVPLDLVARIEKFDSLVLSYAGGRWMAHHDDRLIPVVALDDDMLEGRVGGDALILDDGHRRAALPIDRVVDIVADPMLIEQPASLNGIAGIAIVDGMSVEVVDIGWVMGAASRQAASSPASILIIGNRQFAAGVLKPLLESAGHTTTVVADHGEAAALAGQGAVFDLTLAAGDLQPPTGLSPATLYYGHFDGDHRERESCVDPYDRAGLLEAVNISIGRTEGAAA